MSQVGPIEERTEFLFLDGLVIVAVAYWLDLDAPGDVFDPKQRANRHIARTFQKGVYADYLLKKVGDRAGVRISQIRAQPIDLRTTSSAVSRLMVSIRDWVSRQSAPPVSFRLR